jgi:hypothetical protein
MENSTLARPPRTVPWSLRIVVLFGGVLPQVGWGLLALGLALTMVFGAIAAPLFDDPFAGPVQRVAGKVGRVDDTSLRINKNDVVAVHFEVQTGDRTRAGRSYAITYRRGGNNVPEVGSEVQVEIARTPAAPMRIVGLDTHMLPAAAQLVVLLPIAGAVLVLCGVWRNARRLRLLVHGEVATAMLVASEPTNTTINGRRVQAMTFRFLDGQGRTRTTIVRTHRPEAVTDDEAETVVYDPGTGAAVLLDALPGKPQRETNGELQPAPFDRLALVMIGPTLVLMVWQFGAWAAG